MKKTTAFFLCLIATICAVNGQNEFTSNRGAATLTDYVNRVTFEADYGYTLINENFSGGPGEDTSAGCGIEVSSTVSGCFTLGVLKEGFKITSKTNQEVRYVGLNALAGNTIPLIGSSIFGNVTILTFIQNDIYAAGFDLFAYNRENTVIRIYDTTGELLNTFTATSPFNTLNFFGVLSDVAIGKIEIEAEDGGAELIGNLTFGNDIPLSINDNTLIGFNFYPNPVSDVLNISAIKNIESVSLFNMLGQRVLTSKVDGTKSAISLSRLSPGTYIMEVTADKQNSTYKVMKN